MNNHRAPQTDRWSIYRTLVRFYRCDEDDYDNHMKKTSSITTKNILLQHFWAEMGHRQVVHMLKYTKKKCCTTSCLNLIKIPFLQ